MSMETMRATVFAAGFVLLASCGAQPKYVNMRVDQVSSLEIVGGPLGAAVLIDGIEVWQLKGSGKDKIPVSDGEHAVRIVSNGFDLYKRAIFVRDGTRKTIKLP